MLDELDLLDLDHCFGELVALHGVSSEVGAVEIVGFLGRLGRMTLPRAQIRLRRDAAQAL